MSYTDVRTIEPNESSIPETAIIQKTLSDEERLPADQHDKAVKAFCISDGIASGISNDLAFVDKIPHFIEEVIESKSWECLYVAKGVVTPYYCRYVNGTDLENFRAFITAKRPNGLETSVETLDRVLRTDSEVYRKFSAIIYDSCQGRRTDLIDATSPPEEGKLKHAQQERFRAANRASVAIPVVGQLLDRKLIATSIAAKLGRVIKDPENLTAEEREYVDKRDLIGLRIQEYVYRYPIPEDEDKELQYSRELNRYVKDLLDIKDRSTKVRMDNPKKAAEQLFQYYQGDKLKELIEYLMKGVEPSQEPLPKLNLPALKPAKDFVEAPATPKKQLTISELAERLGCSQETIKSWLYKHTKRDRFSGWTQKHDPEHIAWQRYDGNGSSLLFIPLQEQ